VFLAVAQHELEKSWPWAEDGATGVLSDSAGFVDCGAGCFEGMSSGQVEGGELFGYVLDGDTSFGVLDEGVIALPMALRLLVHLHFDLDAFVHGLNHGRLPGAKKERECV